MRRFELERLEDETGISGTGAVAEGVEFYDGTVAMRWRTNTASTAFYDSITDVETIHGHGGKTVIRFLVEEA
jgi:predicted heme/steroid binding protein